jgi:hypothetical protein
MVIVSFVATASDKEAEVGSTGKSIAQYPAVRLDTNSPGISRAISVKFLYDGGFSVELRSEYGT